MSSAESTASGGDTEYADHVHQLLRYVPVYGRGAFSCSGSSSSSSSSSSSDGDRWSDDEDVKRILAARNAREPDDRGPVTFSPAYASAAAAAAAGLARPPAADYTDWDEAEKDAAAVYPPLGAGVVRAACRAATSTGRADAAAADDDDGDGDDGGPAYHDGGPADHEDGARELRRCLEGALHGHDLGDFVVAQPFCAANKNLDFGKSKMSLRAVRESTKKVENWMSKYTGGEGS